MDSQQETVGQAKLLASSRTGGMCPLLLISADYSLGQLLCKTDRMHNLCLLPGKAAQSEAVGSADPAACEVRRTSEH